MKNQKPILFFLLLVFTFFLSAEPKQKIAELSDFRLLGERTIYLPLKLQTQEVSTSEDCNSVRISSLLRCEQSNKSVSQETEVKISGGIFDADFKPSIVDVITHYDKLIDEGNDPVHDAPPLREYMDKWNGDDFIDALELTSEKSALEIGVGTGRLAIRTAAKAGRLLGIDVSPKTIERARENLSEFQNVSLVCGDFLDYDFREKFDVIYSSLTFMHIREKQAAVNKVAELLKDGGRFVISIDKNKSEWIDMGNRKVRVHPDCVERICECVRAAGMTVRRVWETENADVVCGEK